MTAPLYRQTCKVQHISANGSYMLNRRRCIECDTYHDLMHFAADSRVCDACAVAAAGGREASAGSGATLPCLNSNNSISEQVPPVYFRDFSHQETQEFSTSGRKSAAALEMNIHGLIDAYGIDNCAFVTLTFPDHVTDPREASRRFNSLNSNFLRHQIDGYVGVFELHKSGRIHFHFVVNLGFDCRTGFDFQAVANGDYSSASPRLRALLLVCAPLFFYYSSGRFKRYVGAEEQPAAVAIAETSAPAQQQAAADNYPAAPPMAASVPIGAKVEDYRPRIANLQETAPIYDSLRQVADFPRRVACVASADSCNCYSQQATILPNISTAECRAIVKQRPFDPYRKIETERAETTVSAPPSEPQVLALEGSQKPNLSYSELPNMAQ